MTTTPALSDDETYVDGRSSEKAAELLKLAKDAGLEGSVRTTSHGYIVPSSILGDEVAEEEVPAKEEEPADEFDPSKATADEVLDYLNGADDTERERVLAAETEGKARKTVLAYTPEGDK